MAETLLEHKADPDIRDHQGATALSWAADAGQAPFVKLLLKAKAALEDVDFQHNTALIKVRIQTHANRTLT